MKKLGFGCMRLPMNGEEVDLVEFSKMVDVFMERGFTYFDTAKVYIQGKIGYYNGALQITDLNRDKSGIMDFGSSYNREDHIYDLKIHKQISLSLPTDESDASYRSVRKTPL